MASEKPVLLLVDSSTNYLLRTGMLLRKLNFLIWSSKTGEDALKTMADAPPSLVLTDTALPSMSGIDLARAILHDPQLQRIPVIVHSSAEDPAVERACLDAGCAAYFRKPADTDQLYRAIHAALKATPRQQVRIDTFFPVEIGSTTGPARRESVVSLSENGLFVKTLALEPVHAVLPLTLHVGTKVITASAMVLYLSPRTAENKVPGMGMRFVDIRENDRAALRAYIEEQLTTDLVPEQRLLPRASAI